MQILHGCQPNKMILWGDNDKKGGKKYEAGRKGKSGELGDKRPQTSGGAIRAFGGSEKVKCSLWYEKALDFCPRLLLLVVPKTTPGYAGGKIIASSEE